MICGRLHTHVPRTDGRNGLVAQYELYTSNDGKTWGTPVAKGSWARSNTERSAVFEQPQKARYIRFVTLKGFEGQKWTSMAELKLIPVDP